MANARKVPVAIPHQKSCLVATESSVKMGVASPIRPLFKLGVDNFIANYFSHWSGSVTENLSLFQADTRFKQDPQEQPTKKSRFAQVSTFAKWTDHISRKRTQYRNIYMLSPKQLLRSVTEHWFWHLRESANKTDRNSSPVKFTSPIFLSILTVMIHSSWMHILCIMPL